MDVSRDTRQRLEHYQALLVKWQKAINLVGPKTIADSWIRHFEDSLQLEPLIPNHVRTLVDIGSGAGFPGLPLAIVRPDIDVHMVESDDKKCQFMRTVSRETQCTNVTIHNNRIEEIVDNLSPDCLTARALASLDKLLLYSQCWHDKMNFTAIFMKGEKAEHEIRDAKLRFIFDLQKYDSITDPSATILEITSIKSV